VGPENFAQIRPTVQKLRHFFEVTDARTDGRTDIYESPLYHREIFFFFCIYVRGKEGNFTNPTKFLPLHFVKDKLALVVRCSNLSREALLFE